MTYFIQTLNLYLNKIFFINTKNNFTFIKKIIYKTFNTHTLIKLIKYISHTLICDITNIYHHKSKKKLSQKYILIHITPKNNVNYQYIKNKPFLNNNIILNINYEYNIKKQIFILNIHISLSIYFICCIYQYINKLIHVFKPNILKSYYHIISYPYNILQKIFLLSKIIFLSNHIHKTIKKQYDIYKTNLYQEKFFYTKIIKKIHINKIFNWEYQYYKFNKLNLIWLNSYLNKYINQYYV